MHISKDQYPFSFVPPSALPDPPSDVRLKSCSSTSAAISWTPGSDNHSPIQSFLVLYNTSHDEEDDHRHNHGPGNQAPTSHSPRHVGASIDGSENVSSAVVRPLTPWTEYSFYVVAENEVGRSWPPTPVGGSRPVVCRTPGTRPSRSPRRVCTDSRLPGQLAVVWEVREIPLLLSCCSSEVVQRCICCWDTTLLVLGFHDCVQRQIQF